MPAFAPRGGPQRCAMRNALHVFLRVLRIAAVAVNSCQHRLCARNVAHNRWPPQKLWVLRILQERGARGSTSTSRLLPSDWCGLPSVWPNSFFASLKSSISPVFWLFSGSGADSGSDQDGIRMRSGWDWDAISGQEYQLAGGLCTDTEHGADLLRKYLWPGSKSGAGRAQEPYHRGLLGCSRICTPQRCQ